MCSYFAPLSGKMRVLVTGGTGLVGHGLQAAIEADPSAEDTWFFLSSRDFDLRSVFSCFLSLLICIYIYIYIYIYI